MPIRIQRKRTKGFKMPPNTVYVGRPSQFKNPFNWQSGIKEGFSEQESKARVVQFYHEWVTGKEKFNPVVYGQPPKIDDIRKKLKGKNLSCWCKPGDYCHADVLLEIANAFP